MAINDNLSLPALADGLTYTTSFPWTSAGKTQITAGLSDNIGIYGLSWFTTSIPTANTIREFIFEFYTGASGSEVLKVQIPFSIQRVDTTGYYLDQNQFVSIILPEPFYVASGTRISFTILSGDTSISNTSVKMKYTIVPAATGSSNFFPFF